jgi:hypothetical protein
VRLLGLAALALLLGCDATRQHKVHDIVNPSAVMVETVRTQIEKTEEIETANTSIGTHLEDIDGRADKVLWHLAMIPDGEFTESDGVIQEETEAIRESVDEAEKEQVRVEEALEDLEAANARVSAAIGEVHHLEDLLLEYEKTDREIRQEALKNLRGFISLAFAVGFCLLIGGAFVALKVDGRLGGVAVGVGILAIGFAAASQYYLEEIAVVGLVALVVGFIVVVFMIINVLMKGSQYKDAIREIVELIEEIKDYMSNSDLESMRKQIFGPSGFANQFTNEITKKIIAEVKAKNNFDKLSRKKGQL